MKKMIWNLSLAVVAVGLALQLPVPAKAGTAEDVQAAMQLDGSNNLAVSGSI